MAKNGIKAVENALEKGFQARDAEVYVAAEMSDYKDFIRMFVVSDFFRRKSEKERLGEVFSIMKEFGAESAIAKISFCVALTRREFEKEFGKGTLLISHLNEWRRGMKSRPRGNRLARVHA